MSVSLLLTVECNCQKQILNQPQCCPLSGCLNKAFRKLNRSGGSAQGSNSTSWKCSSHPRLYTFAHSWVKMNCLHLNPLVFRAVMLLPPGVCLSGTVLYALGSTTRKVGQWHWSGGGPLNPSHSSYVQVHRDIQ